MGERGQVQIALNTILQIFQFGVDPNTLLAATRPVPMPQPMPVPVPPMPVPMVAPAVNNGQVLALGADGSSGYLYEKTLLPDGFFQQLALVKRSMCGRVVGKNGINLTLLKNKSGAVVTAEKSNNNLKAAEPDELSKVTVIGSEKAVQLCAQMLQEIISNGHKRIVEMPDVPFSLPQGYMPPSDPMRGYGQQQQQQQFGHGMMPMHQAPPDMYMQQAQYGMNVPHAGHPHQGHPNPNMMPNMPFNHQQHQQQQYYNQQMPPRYANNQPDNSYPNIGRINLNSQSAPPNNPQLVRFGSLLLIDFILCFWYSLDSSIRIC